MPLLPFAVQVIDGNLSRASTIDSTDNDEIREKIWLSPMTKAPPPKEMSTGQIDNTTNTIKNSVQHIVFYDEVSVPEMRIWSILLINSD